MTAWLILILLVAATVGLLWALGVRGALLQLAGAALMLGSAGYGLQGRPSLPGSPGKSAAASQAFPLTAARRAFFGDFSRTEHCLIMSESMASRGKTGDAVNVLRSAVREHPRDPQLWIGLGNALVDHARGLTPPAELAYAQAAEVAPGHPAATFFLGLAKARSGERQAALAIWRQVLANAPADASWRPLVEDAIRAFSATPAPPR